MSKIKVGSRYNVLNADISVKMFITFNLINLNLMFFFFFNVFILEIKRLLSKVIKLHHLV